MPRQMSKLERRVGMIEGRSTAHDEETEASISARLDRELNELLQELRVVQGGILLLVGFLLVIAFSPKFDDVTQFEKVIYYLTLLDTASAGIVVVAPVAHHRLAFRRHDKAAIVERGNLFVLVALAMVGVSIVGIGVLITHVLFSAELTLAVAIFGMASIGLLWFLLPLESIWRNARDGSEED